MLLIQFFSLDCVYLCFTSECQRTMHTRYDYFSCNISRFDIGHICYLAKLNWGSFFDYSVWTEKHDRQPLQSNHIRMQYAPIKLWYPPQYVSYCSGLLIFSVLANSWAPWETPVGIEKQQDFICKSTTAPCPTYIECGIWCSL